MAAWRDRFAPKPGKVYIIPTRFGLLFLMSVMIMLLVGAVYANNLVNLLAFFLLSIAMIAMVQTHNNLKNVEVERLSAEPGFAGGVMTVGAVLRNPSKVTRFNLEIQPKGLKAHDEPEPAPFLHAQGTVRLKGAYAVQRRGRYRIRSVRASTVYPLGLFYAWMWLPADFGYHVYPRPEGSAAFPSTFARGRGVAAEVARGGEDFHGHRRYQRGDSSRHIDWKARARGRPLLTKEFDAGEPSSVVFDWSQVPAADTEKKLSQLAQWIETARRREVPFGLRLPRRTIEPSSGMSHYHRCLEELATYEDSHAQDAG